MNDKLLEADDLLIEADEWAELKPTAAPLSASAELDRQMNEFLARGGQIKSCGPGESAIPINNPLWSFPVGKAGVPNHDLREAGEARRKAAQSASQRRGTDAVRGTKLTDDDLIVIIDKQLGVAKNTKLLCEALGCSNSLLQRLLFCHFRGDERADPYRSMSRLDHEAAQIKKIRELLGQGHTGIKNITKLMGLKNRTIVANLDRNYGLKIPREEPGKKAWSVCDNTLCHAKMASTARYCPQCGTITALGIGAKNK